MASLSFVETRALSELSGLLYDFLPGSTPYGQGHTWPHAAAEVGAGQFWQGGSKRPAINRLLELTLQHRRDRFCALIMLVIREGLKYRDKGGRPVTRQELQRINEVIVGVGFKIPELHDPAFLRALPSEASPSADIASQDVSAAQDRAKAGEAGGASREELSKLHDRFLTLLCDSSPQSRGYALEGFLGELFHLFGLAPRGSFRVAGEQIDGSFEWQSQVFLVEARWREQVADTKDLLVLRGKVEGKSEWTRGLFLSINGFSGPAIGTIHLGRRANLITMDGQDLILILEGRWSFPDALRAKLRHAGETGEAYLPLARATP